MKDLMRLVILLLISLFSSLFQDAPTVNGLQATPTRKTVTIEIRYNAPEAGVVNFVWGTDEWHSVPEGLHMKGTTIQDGLMFTPMHRNGQDFVAKIRVPAGAIVQYRFYILEMADGRNVDIWDKGKDPDGSKMPGPPILIASYDKVFFVDVAENPRKPFVTQPIFYRYPEAHEVELVWGIGSWNIVPEATSAAETTIKDDLMRTQMVRVGDMFQANIQVPIDSRIRYGFMVVMQEDDDQREWDGGYSTQVNAEPVEINPQIVNEDTIPDIGITSIMLLISKHWPLILIGICIIVGILIGFRKT